MDIAQPLPADDVFFEMRQEYVSQLPEERKAKIKETVHLSIAWDFVWMASEKHLMAEPVKVISIFDSILERERFLMTKKLTCSCSPRSILMCLLSTLSGHEDNVELIRFEIVRRLIPSLCSELQIWIPFLAKNQVDMRDNVDEDQEDVMACAICNANVPFFFMMWKCDKCKEQAAVCASCSATNSEWRPDCCRWIKEKTFEARHKTAGKMLELFNLDSCKELLKKDGAVLEKARESLLDEIDQVHDHLESLCPKVRNK